jgi:hypothetical protein
MYEALGFDVQLQDFELKDARGLTNKKKFF